MTTTTKTPSPYDSQVPTAYRHLLPAVAKEQFKALAEERGETIIRVTAFVNRKGETVGYATTAKRKDEYVIVASYTLKMGDLWLSDGGCQALGKEDLALLNTL